MTTTTTSPIPNIPLPPGAVFGDEWQPEGHRTVEGEQREIRQPRWHERERDVVVEVWTHALQHADGHVDSGGDIEPPLISVSGLVWEEGITADTARQLADLLVTAADEIDGWAAK